MNKNLISLNPVLRFKLGKLILKFEEGGNPIWFFKGKLVETTKVGLPRVDGLPINNYKNNPSFLRYDKVINTAKGKTWAIRDGKYYDPSTGKLLNSNLLIYDKNSGKKYSIVNGEILWYTAPKVEPEYNGGKSKVLKEVVTAKKPTTVLTKATTDWGTEYQKALGNLTLTLKDYLTSLGADLSDVKSLLRIIGTKDDGKFGNNSNSALIAKLAEMPRNFGISNKPNPLYSEEVKLLVNNAMNLTQIDPYRAYNNYSGLALKNLGFNNYNTMVNYVLNNPQNQFSKDLTKRFGDVNTWNQADIEQNLGVYGNYRGSRTGDFGDIARSMSTWAGNFNGTLDGKVDLASRTGSDGIVYSNSRVRDLFDKSLLSKNPVTRFKKGGFVNFRVAVQ